MSKTLRPTAALVLATLVGACATSSSPTEVLSNKSAVELRTMQTRAFDTADRTATLRTIIATLQDLGYSVGKVEPAAGTVSATKLGQLRLTATAFPRGTAQTAVRANAMVLMTGNRNTQVDDPVFYQQLFFEPLAKALFLTALQVEDAPPAAAAGQAGAAKTN